VTHALAGRIRRLRPSLDIRPAFLEQSGPALCDVLSDVAVRRGASIGAAQVGLLAAVGRNKVLVHPRPRVSVISLRNTSGERNLLWKCQLFLRETR